MLPALSVDWGQWVSPDLGHGMAGFANWLDANGIDDFAAGFGDSMAFHITAMLRDTAGYGVV
jgi:hypothetical protein